MTLPAVVRIRRATNLTVAIVAWTASVAVAADVPVPTRSHLVPVSEAARTPSSVQGLGMTLSRASPVLRRQLALTRGAGLVVDAVTAGSPAARAGFEPHDVVVRLDDQILVLPEQLDALLEGAEPGDPLVCTVLRGGHEVAIPLAGTVARLAPPPSRTLRPTASSLAIVKPPKPAADPSGQLRRLSDETLLREDGDYRIQLTRGDETRLTVTDLTGQIVFDAAIENPAAQSRIPMAIRGRVAEMVRLLEPRAVSQGQLVGAPATGGQPAQQGRAVERVGHLDLPAVELR
jgi:hypothetical protein